ncbi:hypothetical protein SLEP1_g47759 [Rubroshorea leprosula]|uniref:Uncharacterized protein n=1 Tax=Rubroshorea leprosula TaxID=152421 RepID=A0AAV5LUB4_9ROSI|nr:hypothetical protein SLEP1_g47759 [Rubroshorea leprosula]
MGNSNHDQSLLRNSHKVLLGVVFSSSMSLASSLSAD